MLKWLLLLFPAYVLANDFSIHLEEPKYQNGELSTDSGGIATSKDIRIQARSISSSNEIIHAEGDLLVAFGNILMTGKSITYNHKEKTGEITCASGMLGMWLFGGEKVLLHPDQSITVEKGHITTSEETNYIYALTSGSTHITNSGLLTANNIQFQVKKIPVFYFPYFRANLKKTPESPLTYSVQLISSQGPKLSMRYLLYSWKYSDFFARVDLRPSRGFGGAIETYYHSPNKLLKVQTKNYAAHDTFFNDTNPNRKRTRYRLQGLLHGVSRNKQTETHLQYDKYNDRNMSADFATNEFQLDTAKVTKMYLRHYEPWNISYIGVRPRINFFQGFTEELPTIIWDLHPIPIGNTQIITDNHFSAQYLKNVQANEITQFTPEFSSIRIAGNGLFYRPFRFAPMVFTPMVGYDGIVYSNSPNSDAALQGVISYGANLDFHFYKTTFFGEHKLSPFASFQGLTKPTTSIDNYYVFSLLDGINKINQLEFGIKNAYFFNKYPLFDPNLTFNVSLLSFFAQDIYKVTFPKVLVKADLLLPSASVKTRFVWNFENQVLDIGNVQFKWTLSEYVAVSLEFRHRSKYGWKKDDPYNYILDISRPISELLRSPLSDGRNVFLSRLQMNFTPTWTMQLQSHQGWGRSNAPSYSETRVDLIKLLATHWKMKLSFAHTERANLVTFSIKVVK